MENKLKILHANTGLVAGGVERLIADMLPFIKKRGMSVEILILEDNGDNIFEKTILDSDIRINKLRFNNKFDLRNILEIRRVIRQFDIIHVHIFPMLYLVPIASIGLKKKPILITTEHNTHNRRRDLKIFKIIEKIIYAMYDKIISISPETENNLLNWLGERKTTKYDVVSNGVNVNVFKNADKLDLSAIIGTNVSKEDKFLLMVARFDSQKDHETLLKALQIIPDHIKLLLVGEGKLEDYYKNRVQQFGIDNRVFFLGRRQDIPNIVKSVDVSILSSHWEGFGLVIVEAMSAGIPVIASSVPGVSNVVAKYGLLFEKGDFRQLAQQIQTVINDQETYNYYSNMGLKRAEEFNIEKMVDQYVSIYTGK